MRTIKIRKELEEQMDGICEVHENIIIWAYKPEWIMYSENFLEIDQVVGMSIDGLLKILSRVDERTEVKVNDEKIKFSKWNNQRKYKVSYVLPKYERDILEKGIEILYRAVRK